MAWILLVIFGVSQVTAPNPDLDEVPNKLADDINSKIKQGLGDAAGLVSGSVNRLGISMDKAVPENILDDYYNKYVTKNIDSGLKIIKNVENWIEMPNDKEKLDKLIEAMPDDGKLGDIKKIYKEANNLISGLKDSKDIIKEGLSALCGSLMETLSGVVNGNWQDMLSGGLSVIGSLLMLAGPIGAAISSVMSLVSGIFSLFGSGGGLTKIKESQEGMIKRVINEALEKSRAEELKGDAEGFKKEMTSVRNSINQFRESKTEITESHAAELYNQAFVGVNFFGKLNFYINKYCESSIPPNKVEEMRESSSRCLEFLNLYSDLSILRQLLIVDMASLLGSNKNMEEISKNLLRLIEKEKVTDKDLLMFLHDPINYKSKRFFISQYFGAPNKYPTIKMYLSRLSKLSEGKQDPQKVVICSEKELMGLCYQVQSENQELGEWSTKVQSLYVPDGYLVYGFIKPNREGSSYGPFPGPTVIGMIPGDSDKTKWKSLDISKTEFDASHFVRVCAEENLKQSDRCDMLKAKDYSDLKFATGTDHGIWAENGKKCLFPFFYKDIEYNTCTKAGTFTIHYWCATEVNSERVQEDSPNCLFDQTWSEMIKSMSIPEYFEVFLYTSENFEGTAYGPYYGPNTLNKLCAPNTAKSMKISYTKTKTSGMVLICTEESMNGMCDYITTMDYKDIKDIKGCNWEKKIKSMRVPEGLSVTMWTKPNFEGMIFGPYTGSISIASIDGSSNDFFINSMKIAKITVQSSVKMARKRTNQYQ